MFRVCDCDLWCLFCDSVCIVCCGTLGVLGFVLCVKCVVNGGCHVCYEL